MIMPMITSLPSTHPMYSVIIMIIMIMIIIMALHF